MTPNSAPMAAVYLTTGKELFSRPVAAWSESRNALVIHGQGETRLLRADYAGHTAKFLGLWLRSWSPSYDEMASLLPQHIPGTPDPLATRVIIRELPDGWAVHRVEDDSLLRKEATLHELKVVLSAVGGFLVEKIIRADES